jgi:hypothetical protein
MRSLISVFSLAILLAVTSSAVITNGGFENPANTPIGGYVTYTGGESFPGWQVGGDSINVHHTGHTTALAGIQSLDLSGAAAGSITQSLSTVSGLTYQLIFGYGAHSYHPYSGPAMAQVFWGGVLADTVSRVASPNTVDINWTTATYSLLATSSTTELSFVSLSPNGGILLDEISASPLSVPVIPSFWLLGPGLLGIRYWRRPRNN